ncbi:hypothetical protein R6Q59_031197 [Mikania micrantha]|uniref:Uncharacterized protein n=1 Tax=Mikania micrantha TaxID=192012 RepID=A0A5N6NYX9_9ASTR|nr:hypothetical protein E3N88_15883 [Mikania micrantha]
MAGAGGAAFKFVKPNSRPQATDIQAAAAWGVAAFTTAVWIVQVEEESAPTQVRHMCYAGLRLSTWWHNVLLTTIVFTASLCWVTIVLQN